MGVVASNVQGDDGGIVAELTQPSQDDWISRHAEACKMTDPQVVKLWTSFQELGCDGNGQLSDSAIARFRAQYPGSHGIFLEKIIKRFPMAQNGGISFQTYCNAKKWFSDCNTETRIRGAFRVLNNGNPLTGAILVEILREIYTETSEAVIERTAQVFLTEVDAKGQGSIDEDDFVTWVLKMPVDVVEEIMKFNVPSSSEAPLAAEMCTSNPDRLPIAALQLVANNVRNRDWLLLVNRLGFTEDEIKEVGNRLGDEKRDEQLFELLKIWRSKPAAVATTGSLREALVSCGMEDVATML